jgi:hypothetical protein
MPHVLAPYDSLWPLITDVLGLGLLPQPHGGTDDLANLRLVHANCHRQIHRTSAPLGANRARTLFTSVGN